MTDTPARCRHLPDVHLLFDTPVRDPSICVMPDGSYLLVGTTGPDWWRRNDGIPMWRSEDLRTWDDLGLVWTIDDDGTWHRAPEGESALLWAPEVHWIRGGLYLTYSMPVGPSGRTGLLRNIGDDPTGPYVDVADEPLTDGIDASLFVDDDGSVYFVWQNGRIARMGDDLSGLAEEPRLLKPADHHHVGFEGAFLTKLGGRYHLLCADFTEPDGTPVDYVPGLDLSDLYYSCWAASADTLDGPWSERYLAIPHGGHNMIFVEHDSRWWSTFFGNDSCASIRERPGLVGIALDDDGRITAIDQPL